MMNISSVLQSRAKKAVPSPRAPRTAKQTHMSLRKPGSLLRRKASSTPGSRNLPETRLVRQASTVPSIVRMGARGTSRRLRAETARAEIRLRPDSPDPRRLRFVDHESRNYPVVSFVGYHVYLVFSVIVFLDVIVLSLCLLCCYPKYVGGSSWLPHSR